MKLFKILMLIAAVCSGLNLASAQTWTQTSAPSNVWACVASSADGTKLAVASKSNTPSESGNVFTSTNSGLTWTETASPKNCVSIASSADGTKLVAANFTFDADFTVGGGIFTSTDSGATWTSNNVPNLNWGCVASSADGNRLVAAAILSGAGFHGVIYTSTNSGATWTEQTNAPNNYWWFCLASSADGLKLLAMTSGKIFISTNSGSTWTQINNPIDAWGASGSKQVIAMSPDATRLVAAFFSAGENGGPAPICISTNSGATWVLTSAPSNHWSSVSMSADGSKLVAAAGGPLHETGLVYTSTDFGLTWTTNNINAQIWTSVAMSADGNKIAAVAGYDIPAPIYTLQTMPSPSMNITPTNGSFKLSWLIPSTNFVMQQSSDLTSWSDVTNEPVLNLTNLQNEVILPPTNSSGFYRLKTP